MSTVLKLPNAFAPALTPRRANVGRLPKGIARFSAERRARTKGESIGRLAAAAMKRDPDITRKEALLGAETVLGIPDYYQDDRVLGVIKMAHILGIAMDHFDNKRRALADPRGAA